LGYKIKEDWVRSSFTSVFDCFDKGRLDIGKAAPMVLTYLVLSGKKSARSPPAEVLNSKKHAKTHEPPL